MSVIAIPDTINARKMVKRAGTLDPLLSIVLRTHGAEEAELLSTESLGTVFLGEHELAGGMASHILPHLRPHAKGVQESPSGIAQAISEGDA